MHVEVQAKPAATQSGNPAVFAPVPLPGPAEIYGANVAKEEVKRSPVPNKPPAHPPTHKPSKPGKAKKPGWRSHPDQFSSESEEDIPNQSKSSEEEKPHGKPAHPPPHAPTHAPPHPKPKH